MIEQVNNLSIKSFYNYIGPSEKFKSKNIIFGYNGRGKSALSEGLIEEFLKAEVNKNENYRYFNRDYINKNLTLQESGNPHIKGVVANFGQENIDVDKQIEELENQITDIDVLNEELTSLDKEICEEITKIFSKKKGKLSIKNKNTKDVLEIIRMYKDDLKKALKIENDKQKLISLVGDDTLEVEKEKIENLPIINLEYEEFSHIDNLNEIFLRVYDDLRIPSSEIIAWLNKGYALHKEGDKCKFCGNVINLSEIKNKLDSYNSNVKQKDKQTLLKYLAEIKIIIEQLENYIAKEDIFVELISPSVRKQFEVLKENLIKFKEINSILNSKIDKIEDKILYDFDDMIKLLDLSNENILILNNLVGKKKDKLEEQINNLNVLIKGAVCLEIENSTYISKQLEKRELILQNKKMGEENNKVINERILDLKMSKSNTYDFANYISEILQSLEINLKIDVDNNDYILRHTSDNKIIRISDISEGEKNLLMLIYFYYELFDDKEQKKLKKDISLIIMDDPITSMDNVNRMYILALIDKICNIDNIQLFVFTHIWEDFCQILYNKKSDKNNPKYGFFEIKKENNQSKIVVANKNISPYEHDFKEVYAMSKKKDTSDFNDCEIYHYPNVIRRVLEKFLEFKVRNSSPTKANYENIKKVLCNDKASDNDENRISMLLNVCNVFSHTASRNPDEILMAAKFLMSKIENVDKLHFDSMKQ